VTVMRAVADRTIDAPAALVWAEIRSVGGLDRWFPVLDSCTVEGEGVGAVRTLGLVGAGPMKDRILEISDAERRLRYHRFESPFPLDDYVGTVEVRDAPQGRAHVVWSVAAEAGPDKAQALAAFLQRAFGTPDFVAVIESALLGGVLGLERELRAHSAANSPTLA
jgi:hypothetical protein